MTPEQDTILENALAMRLKQPRLNIQNVADRLSVDSNILRGLYVERMHYLCYLNPGMTLKQAGKTLQLSSSSAFMFMRGKTKVRIRSQQLPQRPFEPELHNSYMTAVFALGGFGKYKGVE